MERVVAVTSGKGGVGKTNISVNLAVQMALQGRRACVFDADLGLANINILLGIKPAHNLEDVINGDKRITDILVRDDSGVVIVPGGSGVEKLADMTPENLTGLVDAFNDLDGYDVLFVDTSAGISHQVISFCMAAGEVVLVVVPEPTSFTDGYSLLKILSLNGFGGPVHVIVNRAKSERFGRAVFDKFDATVRKYLSLSVSYLGALPNDPAVNDAVALQRPFVALYPEKEVSRAVAGIARALLESRPAAASSEEIPAPFWHALAEVKRRPLQLPGGSPAPAAKARKPAEKRPADAGEAEPANPLADRILEGFDRLAAAAAEITRELRGIRSTLQKQALNVGEEVVAVVSGDEGDPAGMPPLIPLDFETYAQKRGKGKGSP